MTAGAERMKGMYEGTSREVPVSMFFSTEYMCLHSDVPDYQFLYGPQANRAKAHIKMAELHDVDGIYLWVRGKRRDWRRDYQLVEDQQEVYIQDNIENRRLELSEDYYAIDFPDEPPYRSSYVQYGESQEMINGAPTYSKPKLNIKTKDDVDKLLPLETAESIKEDGMFEGIKLLAQQIGDKVFLEASCNSSFRFALGVLGLQEGLMFMLEEPEVFSYLLERTMNQELEYLKVMASYGVHSAWINDIWCDLISEKDYRKFVMPVTVAFVEQAKELGLKSHYFPSGKMAYVIDYVNQIKPDAFHLEEYAGLDIVDMRNKLNSEIVLYGNVHALDILQNGSIAEIKKEVNRQIDSCLAKGPYVLALGTEVTKKTPPENVNAMIEAARDY